MDFFVDSADVEKIRDLADKGLVDGVTTNPSLVAKTGKDFEQVIRQIADITDGPISAEVSALDPSGMVAEGRVLAQLAKNIAVKLPLTIAGLQACKILTGEGHMVNMTLCFSATQALLAAKAGADYVSPFVGRIDDVSGEGMGLIEEIRQIYDNYGFATQILVASIRSIWHVKQAALIGADAATIPPALLEGLASHPLTASGLDSFMADWHSTKQSIL